MSDKEKKQWRDGDIVQRLRVWGGGYSGNNPECEEDCDEAANEIEKLRSLTRFQDRVIRSTDVAYLTQAEKTLLTAITSEPDYYGLTETEATVMRGLLNRLHKA